MSRCEYTFHGECDSCGTRPILKDTGLCACCTYGEADALWDWLRENHHGKELVLEKRFISRMLIDFNNDGLNLEPKLFNRCIDILMKPSPKEDYAKGKRRANSAIKN